MPREVREVPQEAADGLHTFPVLRDISTLHVSMPSPHKLQGPTGLLMFYLRIGGG